MRTLVIPTGGGNDSVSSLWALQHLRIRGELKPGTIDMLSMLPPGVEYSNLASTSIPRLHIITKHATRSILGTPIRNLPEAALAAHALEFGIGVIYGLDLSGGPAGAAETLNQMLKSGDYDLALVVDVGGDFATLDENTDILSPYMDACAAYAVQNLRSDATQVRGALIGLGLDGETSPSVLVKTLRNLEPHTFEPLTRQPGSPITSFYNTVIHPIRPSQTGRLLAAYHEGEGFPKFHRYSRSFHIPAGGKEIFFADREIDPGLAGGICLFSNFQAIRNRFVCPAGSALEWIAKTQSGLRMDCHELVGQTIDGLLICTPSRQFSAMQRERIVSEIHSSLASKALFYRSDLDKLGLSSDNIQTI